MSAPSTPGKIIAVHVSYRSRAEERGRTPAHPSYFMKPSTSLQIGDGLVSRPWGCELLAFEGEIALIVGKRMHRVAPGQAWDFVSGITAANDFGIYDMRYADLGSNVRSKGIDGFTPVGATVLDARTVDPDDIWLRTRVNGTLVQEAHSGDELLFSFGDLLADIARFVTLEPGDVVLTGTPAGSTVVFPGDRVEVEVTAGSSQVRLVSDVVQDSHVLEPLGAMPRVDDDSRLAAEGTVGPLRLGRPVSTVDETGSEKVTSDKAATDDVKLAEQLLATVSTATIASQLRSRGLSGCTLSGLSPTRPSLRMIGRAKTVQYLPLREDLFAERGGGYNAQKRAVDQIRPGEVLVIGARGEPDAGTIGDILALRALLRGAAGIVTDGSIRDYESFADLDLPCYAGGRHSAVLGRRHVPWTTDVAVDCGGVLVEPGDLLVGDGDGVVVVPDSVVMDVARGAVEQERQERFILERIRAGDSVEGLYPVSAARRVDYEAWCSGLEQL